MTDMADPIDPRLFASSSLPPRPPAYTAAPQHNPAQPYYLPTPSHHHAGPPLSQPAPPSNALDPALEQTPQSGPEGDHEDDDHDDDHNHDHNHDHRDDDADHDGTAHETPGSARSPGDFKRPRACDSCRGLKVRCDQERPDQSCRRCAKAGRPCVTTPPTRKRQKKADSRVAELERKIDALTATLHAQKSGGGHEVKSHGAIPHFQESPPTLSMAESPLRMGTLSHDWGNPTVNRFPDIPPGYGPAKNIQRGPEPKRRKLDTPHPTIPEDMDAIHRDLADHPEMKRNAKMHMKIHADHSHINGLIDSLMSPDIAERVFLRYVNEICPHFPAVPFPPGTTAREIREQKPLLFLSILAGSSHGSAEQLVSQEAQRELTRILKDQLADIIWRNGEKSIEIVQALQISVLWYRPPLHFEQHNFYMMVNCAAVMALDLGLGRKATPNVMRLSIGPFRRYHPNSSSIEARRTFLVCYYLCMSITMVLRRPILLRWTKYMEESVKILQTSPDALPSDKLLCQQVKMAHIGENISVQFCMDDPSVEVAISEPKVIYALKIFENELQQLKDENSKLGEVDPTLRLAEHVTNLYLHEIALHQSQGTTDFQPPFVSESLSANVKKDTPIGPAHIGALGECLTATHGILNTILSIELDTLLTLPVIFCVRAIYAIVCLMKMWVSVTNSGEVGSIIKKEALQIESFTERLCTMFNAIVSRDSQSPHGKFFFVAKRLQERFAQIKEGSSKADQSDTNFEPTQATSNSGRKSSSRQSSVNQTPLHLLSEVAMGGSGSSSGNGTAPTQQHQQHQQHQQQAHAHAHQQQQQQQQAHAQTQQHAHSQQQAQAALQAHAQHTQHQPSLPQDWYPASLTQTPDMLAFQQPAFDINFDFTAFDLGTGSDADLSAMFLPDSMQMWQYSVDVGLQAQQAQAQAQQASQQQQGFSGF